MQFALDLPNMGPFADARVLAEIAALAEKSGWDGFFIWDHVHWRPWPHVDPWVALAAIALRTQRIRLGTMITPIPRRRPQKLARETVSIDQLSKGRLILGVGSGGSAGEYANMGEAETPQLRGALLDEGLEILTQLWSGETVNFVGEHLKVVDATFLPTPVQQPRIPIWVAAFWPNKKPLRRAARYDGVFPQTRATGLDSMMALEDMRDAIAYVARERGDHNFDVVHSGRSSGIPLRDRLVVGPYADIGVTWWLENMTPWAFGWSGEGEWPLAAMRDRIAQGPPQI